MRGQVAPMASSPRVRIVSVCVVCGPSSGVYGPGWLMAAGGLELGA